MNKLQFFVYPAVTALALAAAFSAHAVGGAEGPDYDNVSSRGDIPAAAPALQRAQVKAEVVTVRGTRVAPRVDIYAYDHNPYADFKSTKTRAEVMAEVLAAPRGQRLAAIYGEDIGPFYYAAVEQSERPAARRAAGAGKSAVGQ
jgi:hypothetical protein